MFLAIGVGSFINFSWNNPFNPMCRRDGDLMGDKAKYFLLLTSCLPEGKTA